MKEENLVSIVVPVYNAEKYILKTIESIENQTYTNWELILCENGSTDGTKDVLRALDNPKIKVVIDEENLGAARSRNKGVDLSNGRFVCYIDADDLWRPDKLAHQVDFMVKKDIAFSFTGYEFGDEEAVPQGKIVRVPESLTYEKALRNTTIFTSTVMFDMTKVTKEQIHMPVVKSEDTALWWRLLREGYTAYGLDENLVIYRRPAKSLSSNKLEALRRIWNLYRNVEHLNVFKSAYCFIGWAFRAVKRRV